MNNERSDTARNVAFLLGLHCVFVALQGMFLLRVQDAQIRVLLSKVFLVLACIVPTIFYRISGEKKIKRQIVIVTHNPNVVVGADAEEIIVANQQGIGNVNPGGVKFAYVTGALEDSFVRDNDSMLLKQGIREHVCDLLEGGDKAFKLREQKYQLAIRSRHAIS